MNAWMHTVGWALVHFVWQGAALGGLAALTFHACRRQSALLRYTIACAALTGMLAATLVTAAAVHEPDTNQTAPRRQLIVQYQRPGDADLPIVLETRPPAMPGGLSGADVEAAFPWMVGLWLAGVALLLARTAAGWWRVRGIHRLALHSAHSTWQTAANRLSVRLGIARIIRIVELAHIDVPFVVGCLRPIVVLPVAALSHLNAAQVEAILAHELAHVRRHDYLVNLVQTLAETLLFYHPAVWWLSGRIREEREHCCDDIAIEVSGDPIGYAEALAELETWRIGAVTLAPAATGGSLVGRVRRILRADASSQFQSSQWAVVVVLTAGMLVTVSGFAQTPQENVEHARFEVASVRPASPESNAAGDRRTIIGMQPNGRYNAVNVPVDLLIRSAYQLQEFQLIGGPEWTRTERFDVIAKAEGAFPAPLPGGPPGPAQYMLRSLLEERFKLVVHRETRELPIYALVVGRKDGQLGPQLKKTALDCAAINAARQSGTPASPPQPGQPPVCGIRMGFGQLTSTGLPLTNLASSLVMVVHRSVIDRTGLAGGFDFDVKWTPDQLPPRPAGLPADQPIRMNGVEIDPNGPSIFTALQEQLGLKLEAQRGPVEVLVIDRVARPTPD